MDLAHNKNKIDLNWILALTHILFDESENYVAANRLRQQSTRMFIILSIILQTSIHHRLTSSAAHEIIHVTLE